MRLSYTEVKQLADAHGLPYSTLRLRLDKGVPLQDALIPYKTKVYTYRNETLNATQWAKRLGMTRNTFYSRINNGMTIGQVVRTPYRKKFTYDLVGRRFGRLVAVERRLKGGKSFFKCQCDCGAMITVRANSLVNGQNRCKSAICRRLPRQKRSKHPAALAGSLGLMAEYRLWCVRRKKGLLPVEWQDFWEFIEDVGPRPGPGTTWYLRKEDKDGPYDWTNVGWIRMVGKRNRSVG